MDWKDHPLTAAAISCASTAVFFLTIVTPIYEKKNTNTIDELQQNLSSIEEAALKESTTNQALIKNLENQNFEFSKKIKEQNVAILKLQEEDRFSAENPFPKGFREIGILEDYKKIRTLYPSADISEKNKWMSVKIKDTLFKSATYYPIECNNSIRVSHVLFQTKNSLDKYLEDTTEQRPNFEEQEKSEEQTLNALLATFREKYGQEILNDDEEYYFKVNELWLARLSKSGLLIQSILPDDDLINVCNNPNYCPSE
ncbi:MAG: hypothetical protein V4812_19375 [Pseudomonadota bacterium]